MTPKSSTNIIRTAIGLGLVALLHGLVFLVLLPQWMGEDEPWHFENVVMVAQGHGLQSDYEYTADDWLVAPDSHLQAKRRFRGSDLEGIKAQEDRILQSMARKGFWRRVDWAGRSTNVQSFDGVRPNFSAAHQPPLYYWLAAPLLLIFPDAEPRFQLTLLRLLALVLFVGTVLLTYAAAVRALPKGPGAMLATLFIALWPMSARSSAVVSNDVLARFLVALLFFMAVYWLKAANAPDASDPEAAPKRKASIWWIPSMLLVCAMALFTKTTGACTVVIVGLAILLHPTSHKHMRGTVLALLALGAVVVAGAGAWIGAHNPGVTLSVQENMSRLQGGLSSTKLAALRDSFVGRFNWESRGLDPDLAPYWGYVFLILAALSLLTFMRSRDWLDQRILVLSWGALLTQLILMAFRGVSKGRYLMPAGPALAIILVAGLFALLPKRLQQPVALFAVLTLVAFDGIFIWHGLAREAWLNWRW
ncbi:MAG: 4-amino-4-deoxy-L-arabinose transferase-like glycosyltransferase [Planctomycetota bacterium]|jgi:4-amino-4-deoxy-L-arabinose transferase-like glycosyltransferase